MCDKSPKVVWEPFWSWSIAHFCRKICFCLTTTGVSLTINLYSHLYFRTRSSLHFGNVQQMLILHASPFRQHSHLCFFECTQPSQKTHALPCKLYRNAQQCASRLCYHLDAVICTFLNARQPAQKKILQCVSKCAATSICATISFTSARFWMHGNPQENAQQHASHLRYHLFAPAPFRKYENAHFSMHFESAQQCAPQLR